MIHRAEVKRKLVTRRDRFGQAQPTEEPLYDYPCRLTRASGGETSNERSVELYEVTHGLALKAGADVREDDIITVRDRGGNVLVEDARVKLKKVVYDGTSIHHIECTLSSQRGPL